MTKMSIVSVQHSPYGSLTIHVSDWRHQVISLIIELPCTYRTLGGAQHTDNQHTTHDLFHHLNWAYNLTTWWWYHVAMPSDCNRARTHVHKTLFPTRKVISDPRQLLAHFTITAGCVHHATQLFTRMALLTPWSASWLSQFNIWCTTWWYTGATSAFYEKPTTSGSSHVM